MSRNLAQVFCIVYMQNLQLSDNQHDHKDSYPLGILSTEHYNTETEHYLHLKSGVWLFQPGICLHVDPI